MFIHCRMSLLLMKAPDSLISKLTTKLSNTIQHQSLILCILWSGGYRPKDYQVHLDPEHYSCCPQSPPTQQRWQSPQRRRVSRIWTARHCSARYPLCWPLLRIFEQQLKKSVFPIMSWLLLCSQSNLCLRLKKRESESNLFSLFSYVTFQGSLQASKTRPHFFEFIAYEMGVNLKMIDSDYQANGHPPEKGIGDKKFLLRR